MTIKNRLQYASSPYLKQHENNPVDWYEWGNEALDKAINDNKPIIVSIGYSACHWCHVMAHESFEDNSVAEYMNRHFVCIKVDREERPDIDNVYMDAAHLTTGRGGWPLNAFALPDGKPFYAATYFPKENWLVLMQQIVDIYKNTPDKIVDQANELAKGITATNIIETPEDISANRSKGHYRSLFDTYSKSIDFTNGGFDSTPKFPLPIGIEFLLQYQYYTNNTKALLGAETALTKMAAGGIYDHIGGGFCRYSTDNIWKVPHFEKMLYDNAQLVSLYAKMYQVTGNNEYLNTVEQTTKFLETEMLSRNGMFFSSLDADTEGTEGKFYIWKKSELTAFMEPEHADIICRYFNITEEGNWEHGNNVLHAYDSISQFTEKNNLDKDIFKQAIDKFREKVYSARNRHTKPGVDDKIITSWNALTIKAYTDAYKATTKPEYLDTALKCALFIKQNMLNSNGELKRIYKDGKITVNAFLDDYANIVDAFISLYEVTFDKKWIDSAHKINEYSIKHFYSKKSGLFYYTSDNDKEIVTRKQDITDNVVPGSNSVMANNLFRLSYIYKNNSYYNMAMRMLAIVENTIVNGGAYYANWAILLGNAAFTPIEISVIGKDANKMRNNIMQIYSPGLIFTGGVTENVPSLKDKSVTNKTAAYICYNNSCSKPLFSTQDIMAELSRLL